MTRPCSEAFKQKMVQRLTGTGTVGATRLSKETGVRQQSLSLWLAQARNLPGVGVAEDHSVRRWTAEQKARLLAEGSKLSGEELGAYLSREGVPLAQFERWRIALDEGEHAPLATTKRTRQLEREIARKDSALAEAAALLILKKRCPAASRRRRRS